MEDRTYYVFKDSEVFCSIPQKEYIRLFEAETLLKVIKSNLGYDETLFKKRTREMIKEWEADCEALTEKQS